MDASTFPITFPVHLGFCIIAFLFFAWMFYRSRKPVQLLLMIAMPASLLIYLGGKSLFHFVGWMEAVLLIGALVFAIIDAKKERKAALAEEMAAEAEEAEQQEEIEQ